MNEMNLNGRIFGQTADGMILVKLTVVEFLETLPRVDPAEVRIRDNKELVEAELRKAKAKAAGTPSPDPAIRQPGKATEAQRRFGHPEPRRRSTGKPQLDPRVCVFCSNSFQPKRCDQTCCSVTCRKQYNTQQWNATKKGATAAAGTVTKKAAVVGLTKAVIKPTGKMTLEQKQKRLDMIRAGLAKVDRDRATGGSSFGGGEVPAELTQAQREAANE